MSMMRNAEQRISDVCKVGFDRPWKSRLFTWTFGLISVLFPCSIVFIVGDLLPEEFAWTASVIIMLNALAAMLSELRVRPTYAAVRVFLLVALFLFAIELVGVRTGFPFGEYSYTNVLGFSIIGVPLAISFAWYTSVVSTMRIADWLTDRIGASSRTVVAIVAGLLTLGLDIVLEPMASVMQGYWRWEAGAVPVQNYVSWFVLSTFAAYGLCRPEDRSNPTPVRNVVATTAFLIYGMQFTLFALNDIVRGHTIPVIVSLALVVGIVVMASSARWYFSRPRVVQE